MDAFVFEDKRIQELLGPEGHPQALKVLLADMGTEGQRILRLLSAIEMSDAKGANLRELVTDLVKGAIQYSQGTPEEPQDRMLDMYGKGNVRIVPDGGKMVRCEMVDAYLPIFETPFQSLQVSLQLQGNGKPIMFGAPNAIQTLSYVRTINLLAHYLGIEERIRIFQPETNPVLLEYGEGLTEEQIEQKHLALRKGKAKIFETALLVFGIDMPGYVTPEDIAKYQKS
jgi:hypothetical protein